MRTLISIIENTPLPEANVAITVSKKTGYPVFDIKNYRSKIKDQGSPEATDRAAWNMLTSDIKKTNVAIIENMVPSEDAIKAIQGFDRRVILFTKGTLNEETFHHLLCLNAAAKPPVFKNIQLPSNEASRRARLLHKVNSGTTWIMNTWSEISRNDGSWFNSVKTVIK